jgi:hypothetical protein
MTDNSLEEKQSFLRENILNKGLDGEEFMNFLVKLKGENANDLEKWTLDELKMVKHKINKYSL